MESGKSYIGQTINEERREKEFFSKSEPYTKESSKIDNARKKYGLSKDMWKKEVLKRLWCKEGKEKDLLERLNYWEKYYIKEYDTFNNGYNSTDGGGHDYIFANELKDKLRDIGKEWWNNLPNDEKNKFLDECRERNKKWWNNLSDDEKEKHKKNASKAWLGKHRYASTCESIRQKRLGKSRSNETKEKIRNTLLNSPSAQSKKIKQFDLNGNFIKEYSSISQMHRETGLNYKGVVRCAKGLQKKSYGYIWKFSDEYVGKPKGCKGCSFYNRLGKYRAKLRHKGKEYVLGFYRNEKAASEMYKLALENKDNIDKWFKDIEIHKRSIIEKYE
jgi:hypothetical protein